MATIAVPKATLADLAKVSEKAELIGGRIVYLMATGHRPNRIAGNIYRSLDHFARARSCGYAYTDDMGFAVPELASGRESFSPDASFFAGPKPDDDMEFVDGPPAFAVEVRSKNDFGDAAERTLAAKRADYFEAGTDVVWDVDPVANVIRSYSGHDADNPILFSVGQLANAEPAVPGWTVEVKDVFAE